MASSRLLIHLVRHGETALNAEGRFIGWTDASLSERGLRQARATAKLLESRPWTALHSSPLRRAAETARELGALRGWEPTYHQDLREFNHGELEGRTYPELRQLYPEVARSWAQDCGNTRIPGGETLRELQERVWNALEEIAGPAEAEVCIVSHKMALLTLIARAIGLPLSSSLRLDLELASVSTLERRESGEWRLVSLNSNHSLYV